jgi:hypothetical protein
MRNLFNKDKFIGRPIKEEEANTIININKDKKISSILPHNSQMPNKNLSMLEEVNSMVEHFKNSCNGGKIKKTHYVDESSFNENN